MANTASLNMFDVAGRAMSAQLVRMNTSASNLANAGNVAGSEADAYRPVKAVFAQQLDAANGLSTVRVAGVVRTSAAPIRQHDPGNALADAKSVLSPMIKSMPPKSWLVLRLAVTFNPMNSGRPWAASS